MSSEIRVKEKESLEEAQEQYSKKDEEYIVSIDDVSFSYVPHKPLIENFDLHVEKGQRTAIVGPCSTLRGTGRG